MKLGQSASESVNPLDYSLTEKSLVSNFSKVFEHSCDSLAKLIYLNMAKGKDHYYINFIEFAEWFYDILNDLREKRNEFIFKMLDIDKDGKLSCISLLQIYKNMNPNTLFGKEIFKILKEYKNKNLLMKHGYRSQVVLNFNLFNKLIPYSTLINEFHLKIYGGLLLNSNLGGQNTHICPFQDLGEQPTTLSLKQHLEKMSAIDEGDGQHASYYDDLADYFITDKQFSDLLNDKKFEAQSTLVKKLK
mmetsp:Transcript_18654/g.17749  ORF Transcript_18654/g.17749 Transcript_18654/m.17749 type:complete len:246 (-) Transcript_18654:29-766(-)